MSYEASTRIHFPESCLHRTCLRNSWVISYGWIEDGMKNLRMERLIGHRRSEADLALEGK